MDVLGVTVDMTVVDVTTGMVGVIVARTVDRTVDLTVVVVIMDMTIVDVAMDVVGMTVLMTVGSFSGAILVK
jgi:hypothetical protein